MAEGTLSDPKAQGRLRAREKRNEQVRKNDLKFVMSTTQGRRFVADMIYNRCRWGGVYVPSDSGIYRHEGRRTVAVEMIAEMEAVCPDEFILMVTERMADQQDDKAARDAATTNGDGNA